MASEQNKVITFRLPETAAEQLEQHAKETGTSVSKLLQDLVADFLDEQNPEFAEAPNPLLIRYLLHIIYELVRTRVSLFRIAGVAWSTRRDCRRSTSPRVKPPKSISAASMPK